MLLHLFILHKKKKIARISISDDHLVSDLKAFIAKATDIAADKQTLTHDGVVLEDRKPLKVYKLPENAAVSLDLPLSCSGKYRVYVKVPSKKDPLKLRVGLGTTLNELKKAIAYTQKIPTEDQVLTYRSCVLEASSEEQRTLFSLGVRAEAMLELFLARSRHGRGVVQSADSDSDVMVGKYRKGKAA